MQIIDLEDNIGNEQSLNILCFLKPDSVSYVVRNVQFTLTIFIAFLLCRKLDLTFVSMITNIKESILRNKAD